MSPVSRRRKGKRSKKSDRQLVQMLPESGGCDCPACSGAEIDLLELVDELTEEAAQLVESDDPMDAELMAAVLLSIRWHVGEAFEETLIGEVIPRFEAQASTPALAMLLAIGSVEPDRAGKAAFAAAHRLLAAGIARPAWADQLDQPLTVGNCWRLSDPQGSGSMLICSFDRAGFSHAIAVTVSHLDCGAASDIFLLDACQLSEAIHALQGNGSDDRPRLAVETMDAAELRWQVEKALDARAVHDGDLIDEDEDGLPLDENGPGYPALAVLSRARIRALPVPLEPAPPHPGGPACRAGLTALQALAQLRGVDTALGGGPQSGPGRRGTVARLPAKRRKSDGPAPIYRIKVGLRYAKPPIWRRLEVPADITLARLHTIVQIAFGWDDSHLHVFDTPYGQFGEADADLGHRSAAQVTLEQVAPDAASTLCYTYDFGDDWKHDITVEQVLDRGEAATYPRCTGGRRAAPPEDCGGIWGYHNLLEILADPADAQHRDMLEWLGLEAADDFDPNLFDAEAVTRALAVVR